MPEYQYYDHDPTWDDAYLTREVAKVLKEAIAPAASVFELGCGNGTTCRLLHGLGFQVTGVDTSSSGIAIARQFETDGLKFELVAEGERLDARFGRFDAVLALEVIEHFPSPRDFMSRFSSLISPGGLAIVSTPYHGYLKNLAIAVTGRMDAHFDPLWEGGHLRFFSRKKLAQLFDEFGFTSVKFRRLGRIPPLAKTVLVTAVKPD